MSVKSFRMSWKWGMCVGVSLLTLGCTVHSLVEAPGLQRFSSLRIMPKAVSMVVGATQQFTLVARDSLGVVIPLSELPAPTFTAQVDTIVSVTQDGVATARLTSTSQRIIAKIVVDNLAYADTALVTVTTPPVSPVASYVINPNTYTVAAGATKPLIDTVKMQNTQRLTTRVPFFLSTDPTVATISANRVITGIRPGTTQIIASITAFGVDLIDTAVVTVTNPLSITVNMRRGDYGVIFGGDGAGTVTIAPGGTVTWRNNTFVQGQANLIPPIPDVPAVAMDVTFDNPINVAAETAGGPSGNIPAFLTGTQTRRFPVAGTYTYRSTTNGATGVVIVQ